MEHRRGLQPKKGLPQRFSPLFAEKRINPTAGRRSQKSRRSIAAQRFYRLKPNRTPPLAPGGNIGAISGCLAARAQSIRRWITRALALVLGLALPLLLALPGAATPPPKPALLSAANPASIPLSQQPFYGELVALRANWAEHQLGEVVGETPRATLLNFYAVMAEVAQRQAAISAAGAREPGWSWSPRLVQAIEETDELFHLATKALNTSLIANSIRSDIAEEAAIRLKQVLDYVFNSSSMPITIPDAAELRLLNSEQGTTLQSWRIPGTAIRLSTEQQASDNDQSAGNGNGNAFLFSADTVERTGQMYADIKSVKLPSNSFSTPGFYHNYATTPGRLIPPKWYLKLSPDTRTLLETSYGEQTIFQIAASMAVNLLSLAAGSTLIWLLLKTYRSRDEHQNSRLPTTDDDNIAWLRVLIIFPLLPITRFSKIFVDDYINMTGETLQIITYIYAIIYFISTSILAYLVFEALGKSAAEWLMKWRHSNSPLMLQRLNNLFLPICRTLGTLTVLALLYELLLRLGLPASTVLAFSAVPGLAIGLGASKLLGNLFAGLSIQTDRPLRVGEFCRVGEHTGFITKIGLRSVELQTLESRITIPNAIADEATIVNYSRRSSKVETTPMQGLDLRVNINEQLSPDQCKDLLFYTRKALESEPSLQKIVVSIEQADTESLTLICFAMVRLHGWSAYLEVRERMLCRVQEIIDQVEKSAITVGVSYDTTRQQLLAIPELIKSVVNADPCFSFRSCRLVKISDFSFDFAFDFNTTHSDYWSFKDGVSHIKQDLLACFEANGIEIPYPTAVEISKPN